MSSLIFSAASFGVSILQYVYNLIIARGFSVSLYGEYLTSLSYIMILSVPFSALGAVIVKNVGHQPHKKRSEYIRQLNAFLAKQLAHRSLFILLAGVCLFVGLWWKSNLNGLSVVFVMTMIAVTLWQTYVYAVLQAEKKFVTHGFLLLSIAALKVITGLAIVFFLPNLLWIYLFFALTNAVGLVVAVRLTTRKTDHEKPSKKFKNISIKLDLTSKHVLIPLVTTTGLIALANADLMLVKKFMEPENAGLYGALILMGKSIFYVLAPLVAVAYSFFTGSETRDDSQRILLLLTGLFSLAGVGAFAVYWFFPDLIISILFGSQYLVLRSLLWWSAMYGFLYSLVMLFGHFLMAKSSWWGGVSILALVFQIGVIYFFHTSIEQVVKLTILSLLILSGLYLLSTSMVLLKDRS